MAMGTMVRQSFSNVDAVVVVGLKADRRRSEAIHSAKDFDRGASETTEQKTSMLVCQ